MAMIKCSECGKEVSDKAKVCMNCGCPVESMTPDGTIRIKMTGIDKALMTKQKVSVKDNRDKLLWEGYAGQIAEFYLEKATKIKIKYHLCSTAYSGTCTAEVDPSKGTKYAVFVRQSIFKTNLELQRVDVFDSDY